jgi:hypothetical protein
VSDPEGLKALQARTRASLRAGLENVKRLEEACDPKALEAWVQREIDRFGGRRVQVEDE